MIYILLNLVPILAATAAGLALGVIGVRLSKGLLPDSPALLIVALAEFWLASILAGALILAPPEAPAWIMALATPVVIWIGFIVPVLAVLSAVKTLSRRAGLVIGAHWLAVMLAMACTLQAIGLTAPTPA